MVRPLTRSDYSGLLAFFRALPEEDRIFLRHDVCDPDVVRRWTDGLDFEHVFSLLAVDGDDVVADGTLHMASHGWSKHVGQIRLVTARTHRHLGLAALIARDLVGLAAERKLEKLQAHVIEDDARAVRMFEAVGFERLAVLKGMVKDQDKKPRNLLIMVNDVDNLGRIMEDWIQDSMIPAFRVPGAGEA